MAIIWTER